MPEIPPMPERMSNATFEETQETIAEIGRSSGTDWGAILAPIAQTIASQPALLYRLFGMPDPGAAPPERPQLPSGEMVSEPRDQVRQWANMVRLAPATLLKEQVESRAEEIFATIQGMDGDTLKGRLETVLAQATDHDLQILQGLASILKGEHGSS